MRKHMIYNISTTERNTLEISTFPSKIGNPMQGTNRIANIRKRIEFDTDLDIEEGDIVRCDGIPFQAKPRTYYKVDTVKIKIHSHKPFQLNNGYWVLRRVI